MSKQKVELKLVDYTYTPGSEPSLKVRFKLSAGHMSADWEFTRRKAWDVQQALEDCRKEIQEFAKSLGQAASDPELLKLQR